MASVTKRATIEFEVNPNSTFYRDWDRRRFDVIEVMRELAALALALDRPADLVAVKPGPEFGTLAFGLLSEGETEPAAPTAAELLNSEG